jgi:trehalose 6-phosphate phosphatase
MRVEDLSDCAVFLDLDGTLIDIASAPDLVRIPLELVPLLARLSSALQGALAIVTGRQIVEINRFLDPLRPVAAGVHGAELRTEVNGEVLLTVGPLDPHVISAVRALGELAAGVVIESKVYSIAVHYRLAPSVEPQIGTVLKGIVAGSDDHFILCPGRCVIEVVPRHVSKGAALEALLALPAFKGRRPVMVGDDVPDESALTAAVRLGGYGVRVGGEHFKGLADFEGPADVRAWLASMAARLEGRHAP